MWFFEMRVEKVLICWVNNVGDISFEWIVIIIFIFCVCKVRVVESKIGLGLL